MRDIPMNSTEVKIREAFKNMPIGSNRPRYYEMFRTGYMALLNELEQKIAEQDDQIKELEYEIDRYRQFTDQQLEIKGSEMRRHLQEKIETKIKLMNVETAYAAQAAVIEKLRSSLNELACLGNGDCHGNSDGNRIARSALLIPTDSKQILAEWLDKALGEPELHAYKNTGQYAVVNADDSDSRVIALFKKPEIK